MLRRFPSDTIVLTGGVALNGAFARMLEREAGLPLVVPEHPQHNGAIGCAITNS
jgi:activator of 2-hydroxyglutaryl-CoA dehydratase